VTSTIGDDDRPARSDIPEVRAQVRFEIRNPDSSLFHAVQDTSLPNRSRRPRTAAARKGR